MATPDPNANGGSKPSSSSQPPVPSLDAGSLSADPKPDKVSTQLDLFDLSAAAFSDLPPQRKVSRFAKFFKQDPAPAPPAGPSSYPSAQDVASSSATAPGFQQQDVLQPVLPAPLSTGQHPQPVHGTNQLAPQPPLIQPGAGEQSQQALVHYDPPRPFIPMRTKLGQQPTPLVRDRPADPVLAAQWDARMKVEAGFSPNYQGNILLNRNRSANIPDSQNCALWLTGLPPAITHQQLLAMVRNAGRVFATVINGPEPGRGHFTSAAKIVFFERRAAEIFFERHQLGGIRVPYLPGVHVRVFWNRIKSAEARLPRDHTRVVMVAGPPDVVSPEGLSAFFEPRFTFEVDEVLDHGFIPDGRRLVEYRFGSYRAQAESAMLAIGLDLSRYGVQAWYGRDPCDSLEVLGMPDGVPQLHIHG